MRSVWSCKGCKTVQVAVPDRAATRSISRALRDAEVASTRLVASDLSPPDIEPQFKPIDYVKALAAIHENLESASEAQKAELFLDQYFVFRGLGEAKLARKSLRCARKYATSVHETVVYSAWLRYEKQVEAPSGSPKVEQECSDGQDYQGTSCFYDVTFRVQGEEIRCSRQCMATLSKPFEVMLSGCFIESRAAEIDFSENGISIEGMRAVEAFSRVKRLGCYSVEMLVELLSFSNRFCCERLKAACDRKLSRLVHETEDVLLFLDYALEERAHALVSACLQLILCSLPESLHNPVLLGAFCSGDGSRKLKSVGHCSYALYALLSQVSMECNLPSTITEPLLRKLRDCATTRRQKMVALHLLGCVKLAGKQYSEAYEHFQAAYQEGHVYSLAGAARVKFRQGCKNAAYNEISALVACFKPSGWMYQERSLYSQDSNSRLLDLNRASELDPTLVYPYKYRALFLKENHKLHEAKGELSRVLNFKVSAHGLELRFYMCLGSRDYQGAVKDLRVLLTLEPAYILHTGTSAAEVLQGITNSVVVESRTKADSWLHLHDSCASLDDIGSLAVVHQMLETDPEQAGLYFRQSLLLLRLNCPKAAMRCLHLAREHASSEHERLVYEAWILYDTGRREEALLKADESICVQRSFEALFLKAYAYAESPSCSKKVVTMLEEALKCPSDGLRKGQALNNLGSMYADGLSKFSIAASCFKSAIMIGHTKAHQGLARIHYLQGRRRAAYEEMTKLIEKAPASASAYEKRSEYCDRDYSIADLYMVTQLDPLRPYPYRFRASALLDNQMVKEAIAELSRAIAFKADVQLLHLRASFHESAGDLSAARSDYRAVLSLDSTRSMALEHLS